MNPKILVALPGVAACVIVTLIYPFVLRYAIRHNIVDNPNARKLQRTPVPVFGGGGGVHGSVAGGGDHGHIL